MKRYLLDTSIIIDYLRGRKQVIQNIDDISGELTSSVLCLAELYEGVNRSENKKAVEEAVIDFFSGLSSVFPVDESVARKFGELRAILKKEGNLIADIDIFIAATCVVHNLTLITQNTKDFSRIKELIISP